jgi:hypothetical protein
VRVLAAEFEGEPTGDGRESIPEVARIVGDFVFVEDGDEFGLEVTLAMMFRLAADVGGGGIDLCVADGESTVAILPGEEALFAGLVEEARGTALDLAHGGGDVHGCRQRKQEMDVIGCAADGKGRDPRVVRDAANVGPETIRGGDRRAAVFRREDTVIERRTEGVRHTRATITRLGMGVVWGVVSSRRDDGMLAPGGA